MGTIAVTGSAGGIGGATVARLRERGHQVIGVDVRDAEVIADLSTAVGRAAMVDAIADLSRGTLDGVVAGAGIVNQPGERVVAVNYFGAVATLEGLRPLLAKGTNPSAVAISSNSVSTMPGLPAVVVEACLAGDEPEAWRVAADDPTGVTTYGATKLALARWVRHHAVTDDWIGAGIRLNAVAPGFIATPMTAGSEDFILSLGEVFPMPIRRPGRAEEIAALLEFLLGPDSGFFCGSVVFADGGTDAALRADDWPTPRTD
jgi:NAD(P)-dependent dehydrogenase (short-subunit alcohol dehydrogenase family)